MSPRAAPPPQAAEASHFLEHQSCLAWRNHGRCLVPSVICNACRPPLPMTGARPPPPRRSWKAGARGPCPPVPGTSPARAPPGGVRLYRIDSKNTAVWSVRAGADAPFHANQAYISLTAAGGAQ